MVFSGKNANKHLLKIKMEKNENRGDIALPMLVLYPKWEMPVFINDPLIGKHRFSNVNSVVIVIQAPDTKDKGLSFLGLM